MSAIQTLSSILGLSLASGVNLYAAVLVVGLGVRYGWISGLPAELHALANPIILIIAGVMYLLEFFADKIPFVSVVWDTIHTVIRPLGGAALALASASNMNATMQVIAFLAGGSIALGTHSTKMGYRLLGHASPEPVSSSIFSLAEDFGVVGLVLLVYKQPLLALGVVVALLIAMGFITPLLFRTIAFLFSGLAGRFKSLFGGTTTVTQLPAWLQRELVRDGGANWSAHRCFARSFPGVSKLKPGYLAVSGGRMVFATKGYLGPRIMPVYDLQTSRGLIFDILTVRTGENQGTIYFTKDCSHQIPVVGGATSG
jgi:hypothetical protein